MRIIGPPSATQDTVLANLAGLKPHPRFTGDMFPELWENAESYGIDPVGVVAQSYKETGGGNFAGAVRWQFYNPCGLKIRHPGVLPETTGDQPLAHAMFPNWDTGARAHLQHLRAYAGWPVHDWDDVMDPRYVYVAGKHALENWYELGGKWAPSPTYGIELERLMTTLRKAAA